MEFKYLVNIPAELDKSWFVQAYDQLAARLGALDGSASAAGWLELVAHWNEVKLVAGGERARVNWGEALNVNDEAAAARAKAFHSEIRPLATEQDARLRRALLGNPAALQAVRERCGEFFVAQWECAEIAANPVNIELDVQDRDLVTQYHALRGKAQIEWNGQTHTITGLEKLLESNDEVTRKGAFDALMGWHREHRAEMDGIYLKLAKLRDQAGRNLGYVSFTPLGYKRMRRLDYGPAEAAQFRRQVLQHVTPLVRQLRAEQARLAGSGEQVTPWNRRYLPQYGLPDDLAPVERQLDGALEIFRRLHPALGAHFERMIQDGLIDLENRPGKRGGAFCTTMPDRSEVRIFCNSTGAASDVRTLLHESGHAFQSWDSQWVEAIELREPTLEAAEIHSMGLEFLAYPHLSIFFDPENERKFKGRHLVEALQFLCYACVVDGFQHQVYTNPAVDAEGLADIWLELWDQFMVGEDWSGYRAGLGTFWHHKMHIFARPFYYIDYALAQICALQLWRLSTQAPADALERYLELCRLGGTRSFSDLVRSAGLADPFAEETLLGVLDSARAELGMS